MAAKGLYQKLIIKCLNLSHPSRDTKKCHATGVEEGPNSDTEHLMPLVRR